MIKNIIFDFGGVLLPINEERTSKSFKRLGARKELALQHQIFHRYEKGEVSTKEFLKEIQAFFFRKIILNDLATAWNDLLTPLPEESVKLLKGLTKNYRLFLLSNTNELHIRSIKETAGPFLYHQFIRQFEKVYYSYEMGMRKPDADIYQKVLKENKLLPEETLYVEDGQKHIETAENLGIHTWHFNPEEDSLSDLDKVLSELHS